MIDSLMRQTVTVRRMGRNPRGGGVEVAELWESVRAAVQEKAGTVLDDKGVETRIRAVAYIDPSTAPVLLTDDDPDWEIEHEGQTYRVIGVRRTPDRFGVVGHIEVMLQ